MKHARRQRNVSIATRASRSQPAADGRGSVKMRRRERHGGRLRGRTTIDLPDAENLS